LHLFCMIDCYKYMVLTFFNDGASARGWTNILY
jgi:hypothetical protein